MATALEGGEGSVSRPGRSLLLWKTRYPLYRRLGGPLGRSLCVGFSTFSFNVLQLTLHSYTPCLKKVL